jgi:hypothetical protein
MAKKRRVVVTLPASTPLRRRNPLMLSPLMHRGGAHELSTGAKRRAARMALRRGDFDDPET